MSTNRSVRIHINDWWSENTARLAPLVTNNAGGAERKGSTCPAQKLRTGPKTQERSSAGAFRARQRCRGKRIVGALTQCVTVWQIRHKQENCLLLFFEGFTKQVRAKVKDARDGSLMALRTTTSATGVTLPMVNQPMPARRPEWD